MKPRRIQRKRTKGWRMPLGAVYVGRPTVWGNPFSGSSAVERYRSAMSGCCSGVDGDVIERWFRDHGWKGRRPVAHEVASWLRGHDLACWCALDQPCHADVLLELANQDHPA